MKIEILSEKENALLERREINFRVHYAGPTPSIKDVRADLIGALNSKDDLTVVDSVKPGFGESRLVGYAKVYKDKEGMKIELKHKMRKNFGVSEEEKAAEAAKAAAPAEKKEEKKKKK